MAPPLGPKKTASCYESAMAANRGMSGRLSSFAAFAASLGAALALPVLLAPAAARAGFTPVAGVSDFGWSVVIADIDGDGKLDVVNNSPNVFIGKGDGTFTQKTGCSITGVPVVADFNNDGKLDILKIADDG